MVATASEIAVQSLSVSKETQIAAPIDIAWEAMLAELGPEGEMPGGKPFPFVLETWPGGRWYRDLGNKAGHLWAHVQVIKPPALLELCGPLMMSFPGVNHIQYRLTAEGDHTRIKLTHRAMGQLPPDFQQNVGIGWEFGLNRIAQIAERIKGKK